MSGSLQYHLRPCKNNWFLASFLEIKKAPDRYTPPAIIELFSLFNGLPRRSLGQLFQCYYNASKFIPSGYRYIVVITLDTNLHLMGQSPATTAEISPFYKLVHPPTSHNYELYNSKVNLIQKHKFANYGAPLCRTPLHSFCLRMHRAARCTAQPLRPFAAAARISPEGLKVQRMGKKESPVEIWRKLWKLNLVKGNTNIQTVNQLRMLWRASGKGVEIG